MPKKDDLNTGGLSNILAPGLPHHVFALWIGEWRILLPPLQNKFLIARAINNWTDREKITLLGYLIRDVKIYLIVPATKKVEELLSTFYLELKKQVDGQLEISGKFEATQTNLFTRDYKIEPHIVRLITGKKVTLPYYDVQLARLKEEISNSDFCSAIDYSGAIGPVEVTSLRDLLKINSLN